MSTQRIESVVAMTNGTEECGAIVWWSLNGPTPHKVLHDEVIQLDASFAPAEVGKAVALRRACMDMVRRRQLCRPLNDRGAYAIVRESVKGEEISHQVVCRVKLEMENLVFSDGCEEPTKLQIRQGYELMLNHLQPEDVSVWLCSVVDKMEAVSLRPRGGIYFIPRHHMASWRALAGALKTTSGHQLFEVPAMATDEAVEAILASLTREADVAASAFEAAIEESLGERALNNRVEGCKSLQQKVRTYEALLGTNLDTLRERLVVLEGQLAAAALACHSDTE